MAKARTSPIALFLLWVCGACLRLPVLAVPPVISLIQGDLHLSGTAIGILTGIPVIVFALVATPGSTLIGRFGVRRTLIAGLLIAALGTAARVLCASAVDLYLATIVMSAGIAIMQPTMAAAVRQWVPDRATFGTAVYTNGLIFGEIIPVAIMLPLLLPLLGSWRVALGIWGLPLLITCMLVALLRRRSDALPDAPAHHPLRWLPELNSRLNWRIGLTLGSVSSTYFCMNGFLPAFLTGTGHASLVSAALTALNLGQLPTCVVLLFTADRVQGRRWPYPIIGLLIIVCVSGIMFGGVSPVIWAGLLGAICGGALVLCLALAPLLCRHPDDVARTSAAAFAISYGYAMLVSFLSGVAWDLAGTVIATLIPILLGTVPIFVMARRLLPQRDVAAAV
jgi:CP family cyanate transporter-like MFS transporter